MNGKVKQICQRNDLSAPGSGLFIKPGSVEYVGVGFSCVRGGGKDTAC